MPSSKVSNRNPTGTVADESAFRDDPLTHIRTLLVGFFQGLFAAAPAGAYHWSGDDESTEIIISNENPIHPETIGQRPAITVTRGPLQFYSLGLDDMMSYDPMTGRKQKGVLVPGTFVVNCMSRVDLECDRLAWICAEQLWLHRETLLSTSGFFEVGRQPHIGSPSPAGSLISGDSGDEWYVTPVSLPFQFNRTSATTPLGSPIVQSIQLHMRAALRRVMENGQGCGPVDSSSPGLPFKIGGCPPEPFAPHASDARGNTPAAGEEAPRLPLVPHPLNPAQRVFVRAARPNCPAVKPPSIGGRTIPIQSSVVEESCGNETETRVTATSTVKV